MAHYPRVHEFALHGATSEPGPSFERSEKVAEDTWNNGKSGMGWDVLGPAITHYARTQTITDNNI